MQIVLVRTRGSRLSARESQFESGEVIAVPSIGRSRRVLQGGEPNLCLELPDLGSAASELYGSQSSIARAASSPSRTA